MHSVMLIMFFSLHTQFIFAGNIDTHITSSNFNETIEHKYLQSSQLIRRSSFRNVYGSNNVAIILIDLQKTGSKTLNELFSIATAHSKLKSRFFIPYINRKEIPCVHHGDIELLTQCILSSSYVSKKKYIVYITMIRNPITRLVSEYNQLDGDVSCTDVSWKVFHPKLCNGVLGNFSMIPEDHDFSNGTSESMERERYAVSKDRTFSNWVNLGAANCACNRMARQISGPYGCVYDEREDKSFDSQWILNSAVNNLEQRIIFGLESSYLQSLKLIEKMLISLKLPMISDWAMKKPLQKACEQIQCDNYMTKTGINPATNWSIDLLNAVNHCTNIDQKFYEQAVTIYNERLHKFL